MTTYCRSIFRCAVMTPHAHPTSGIPGDLLGWISQRAREEGADEDKVFAGILHVASRMVQNAGRYFLARNRRNYTIPVDEATDRILNASRPPFHYGTAYIVSHAIAAYEVKSLCERNNCTLSSALSYLESSSRDLLYAVPSHNSSYPRKSLSGTR